jgi:hypothetical protein
MIDQAAPKAALVNKTCALPVLEVCLDRQDVYPKYPLYWMFNAVIEVATIEVLEGNTQGLDDPSALPDIISLEICFKTAGKGLWNIWAGGSDSDFSPQITWSKDTSGHRSATHNALEAHILNQIRRVFTHNLVQSRSFMQC